MASAFPPKLDPAPKVLIVEDEASLRFLLTTILEDDGGLSFMLATSADEAFQVLAQHADIVCVFTDVRMPGRYDGIDLARGILANYPLIKVMITSGNDFDGSPVAGVPFLPKPYELISIPKKLKELMASP